MRILITGGSGDLGQLLAPRLIETGHTPVNIDLIAPRQLSGDFVQGSILDRQLLQSVLSNVQAVVHIAAWHGIHEFRQEKDAFDFWELNCTGTFTLLECAARAGVKNLVFISSTSTGSWPGIYAHSKLISEDLMRTYSARHGMRIITLRPGAFIPPWNQSVYSSFNEWAQWYWKGAVHIRDVAQAVLKALDSLQSNSTVDGTPLTIDGACDFSQPELQDWDSGGAGSTFKRRFGDQIYALAVQAGIDPSVAPRIVGYAEAESQIGYRPTYGFAEMFDELAVNTAEIPRAAGDCIIP